MQGRRREVNDSPNNFLPRNELYEVRLRLRSEIILLPAPLKLDAAGMQGVMGQDEPGALLIGQTFFHEGEVQIRVTAVQFVAHDGMADVREVDADLVFAAREREQAQK